ncbi:unnamed protein product, partial [Arabidopsis lyrata]
NIEL